MPPFEYLCNICTVYQDDDLSAIIDGPHLCLLTYLASCADNYASLQLTRTVDERRRGDAAADIKNKNASPLLSLSMDNSFCLTVFIPRKEILSYLRLQL